MQKLRKISPENGPHTSTPPDPTKSSAGQPHRADEYGDLISAPLAAIAQRPGPATARPGPRASACRWRSWEGYGDPGFTRLCQLSRPRPIEDAGRTPCPVRRQKDRPPLPRSEVGLGAIGQIGTPNSAERTEVRHGRSISAQKGMRRSASPPVGARGRRTICSSLVLGLAQPRMSRGRSPEAPRRASTAHAEDHRARCATAISGG